MERERPRREGGMCVHMPTLPDADRGIPKGGVAPDEPRDPGGGQPLLRLGRNRKIANHIRKNACLPGNSLPAHTHTLSNVHSPIGTDLRRSAFATTLRGAGVLEH